MSNRDFYFNKDIATSSLPGRALNQRAQHVLRTIEPAISTQIRGKIIPAIRGDVDYAGRQRSLIQTTGDLVGFKTYTLRPNEVKKFSLKKKREELDKIRKEINQIKRDRNMNAKKKQRLLKKLKKRKEQIRRKN